MAKHERTRWKGWRVNPTTEIGTASGPGVQGTRAHRRAKGSNKITPWYWIKAKRETACDRCEETIDVGQVVAYNVRRSSGKRQHRYRCGRCIRELGMKVETSKALQEERGE